jgi:hypothetical protein
LSWEFIRHAGEVELGVSLRSLLQVMITLGVRHREFGKPFGALCPSNLLFARDGSALFPAMEQRLPQPLRYRAPECRTGHAPTPKSDIYALGVLLLETLTGNAWADAEALASSAVAAGDGDELLTVARRAVAPSPEDRWASTDEFADALVLAAGRRLAPKLSLAALVGSTLARQGERATPLVPPPAVPRAPAAPLLPALLGTSEDFEVAPTSRAATPLASPVFAPFAASSPSVPSVPAVSAVSGAHALKPPPAARPVTRSSRAVYLAAAAVLGVAIGAWRLLAASEPTTPVVDAAPAASEVLVAATTAAAPEAQGSASVAPRASLAQQAAPIASVTDGEPTMNETRKRVSETPTLSEAAQRALRPSAVGTVAASTPGADKAGVEGAKPAQKKRSAQAPNPPRNAEQRYDPEGI